MIHSLPPQLISIVSSFIGDTDDEIIIKQQLHTISKQYPYYTKNIYKNRIETRCNGLFHSRNDEPAIITNDTKEWYKYGKLHRDNDKPAIVWDNGSKAWYKSGKYHRNGDKPSFIDKEDGSKEWWKNGKLHRYGDKPAIISGNGTKYWYKHGLLHRNGGNPAIIRLDGSQLYYNNDTLYKERFADGAEILWMYGKRVIMNRFII